MGKLARLLLTIVTLTMAQDAVQAQDRACKFAERGFGYIKVEEPGEAWTYSLEASGPNWPTVDVGWHAPGWLSCENCAAAKGAGGLYRFMVRSGSDPALTPPATAAERAGRRQERFGYPSMAIGPNGLEHRASREGLSLGPLSGYAVLYHLTQKERARKKADVGTAGEPELLVISVMDGCVASRRAT